MAVAGHGAPRQQALPQVQTLCNGVRPPLHMGEQLRWRGQLPHLLLPGLQLLAAVLPQNWRGVLPDRVHHRLSRQEQGGTAGIFPSGPY